ncbi:hypothetical protein [Kitasatospora sp. NPDC059571]|uniref:hypothetical protein n=1 Tax=Kitasatospora sp. NPDC059571 TaxID=3346871 RepID=UPI0036C77EA7
MSDTAVNPPGPGTDPSAAPTDVPAPRSEAVPAAPSPVEAPVAPAPAATAAAPRRVSFAVRAAASVVAAALAGVVIGVGILKVHYDDAPAVAAPAPSGTAPGASPSPSFSAKSNGTHVGSLRAMLLPVPDGYRLGPDAGAYGNDTELTEEQRKSWMEDEIRGLPTKLQDALRKEWPNTPLRGGSVRTLASSDDEVTATVWLLQYQHQDAVRANEAWMTALGSDSGLFRIGPSVPGHTEAHCFLPYLEPGAQIDSLDCSAALGDLRVVFQVEGVAPLPKDRLVSLFAKQLDRLALPGASA